ncbi:MAG TPA: FAD-binding protein [Micropepsaceae bacterium]|nr:FAD-binding protein [Micropepsaceae bacterium]
MERFLPERAEKAAEMVAAALHQNLPLALAGAGTKAALGRPVVADAMLSSARMNRILLHEPEELVLTVEAGALLSEVNELLAKRRQMLAFEPHEMAPLLGTSGEATLGGIVAASCHGSRRFRAGGVRDHLLGFKAVNGFGEIIEGGGRVMKNVSGFDVSKLVAGSFGTLCFLTELTFRVWPVAEAEETLAISGLPDRKALEILRGIAGEPMDASGLAHLTSGASSGLSHVPDLGSGPLTLIRLEGAREAVSENAAALLLRFKALAPRRLGREVSARLWGAISALEPFAILAGAVWRLSAPPGAMQAAVSAIGPLAAIYDGAGGFCSLLVEEGLDGEAELIHETMKVHGGHATLLRANETLRGRINVFPPLESPNLMLTKRVKAAFDPRGIFNPGRMYEGV